MIVIFLLAWLVGCPIALIVIGVKYSNLKKDYKVLKERLDALSLNKVFNDSPPNEVVVQNTVVNNTNEPIKEVKPEIKPEIKPVNTATQAPKVKLTDKEIKNSSILIVGSILIIISALLFLTTTWNVTHNVFKAFILLVMLAVFLSASYIGDKVLNLKQTSKAFYYIALAYIPIIFLAIYLFSLFGDYLSIYGEDKYIYLFPY